jgi:SNF2 family DNA or RNA helicase
MKHLIMASSQPAMTEEERKNREQVIDGIGCGSKIRFAINLIRNQLQEDPTSRFVVFSTFPKLMHMMTAELAKHRITSIVVDGSTTLQKRARIIQEFQAGSVTVCVISSRVGNAGLTLTAANHLILLEPNTNVAVDAQAMGRIHRFGQTRPVTIHRIIMAQTVEERIQVLVESGRLDVDDSAHRNSGAIRSERKNSSKLGLQQMKFIVTGE